MQKTDMLFESGSSEESYSKAMKLLEMRIIEASLLPSDVFNGFKQCGVGDRPARPKL